MMYKFNWDNDKLVYIDELVVGIELVSISVGW